MSYQRVIPRDIFNEAKLLKCLGHLAVLCHDNLIDMTVEHDGGPFLIHQNQDDGGLYCENLVFRTKVGEELSFRSRYNSKSWWPLDLVMEDGTTIPVYREMLDMVLNDEFLETLEPSTS